MMRLYEALNQANEKGCRLFIETADHFGGTIWYVSPYKDSKNQHRITPVLDHHLFDVGESYSPTLQDQKDVIAFDAMVNPIRFTLEYL